MLAPEDEDARARKGNETLLPAVEGIAPTAKARPQPGHEPVPVEGRDVRGPAGGDDEGVHISFFMSKSILKYKK